MSLYFQKKWSIPLTIYKLHKFDTDHHTTASKTKRSLL